MKDTLTIWHAVMEHSTVTFLTHDALRDFLGPREAKTLTDEVVVCESEVSQEEYQRLSVWQGAVSG